MPEPPPAERRDAASGVPAARLAQPPPVRIGPTPYVAWRQTALGAMTEAIEQRLILELVGDAEGHSVALRSAVSSRTPELLLTHRFFADRHAPERTVAGSEPGYSRCPPWQPAPLQALTEVAKPKLAWPCGVR